MKKASIVLILGVFVVAVAMQFFGGQRERDRMVAPHVANLLPKAFPGWTVEDRPVADSPDLQKAVKSILSYDDAVFRIYRKGDVEIAVYLAYWLPGKIDPEMVDGHTPDICWPANGWKMTVLPPLAARSVDGVSLPLPNHRHFTAPGQDLTVLFWQINGHQIRQSFSTDEAHIPFMQRARRRVVRIWNAVTQPAGQQVFLRVSSNRPIDGQLGEPPLQACFGLLARGLKGENFYTVGN